MSPFSTPAEVTAAIAGLHRACAASGVTLSTSCKPDLGVALILTGLHETAVHKRGGIVRRLLGRLVRPSADRTLSPANLPARPPEGLAPSVH